MANNRTKETSIMRVVQKAILWGMFAVIIALLIYTILDDIQHVLGIESKFEGVTYGGYYRNLAIIINLAIFWLFFLYFSTPSVKEIFNKLPQGLQFFVASAIFGCISGYFFYHVVTLILFGADLFDDLYGYVEFFGYFVIATGIFSTVSSVLVCGVLQILNRFTKRDFHNVIIRISLIAGCVFGLILGSLVVVALLPQ